jgi:transposase-like protein
MPTNRSNERQRFEFVSERMRRADETFDPEFIVYARKLALLGCRRSEIARNLGCTPNVFERWVNEYPEFRRALDEGMLIGDFAVIEALHKRCTGFTVKCREWKNGNVVGEKEVYTPPDVGACQWWLINRQPDLWKPATRIEQGGPTYGDINARPMVEYPRKDAENDDVSEPDATPHTAP